jgi:hypothetical protein
MDNTPKQASRVAAGHTFARTPGRQEGVDLFDALFAWLAGRVEAHESNSNLDLRDTTRDIAQRVMLDFEKLCRKWEQSDEQGKIY